MTEPVEFLTLEDLIDLAETLLGSPAPIEDVGLLESAAARPQTSLMGQDAYQSIFDKAAALLQSIVKNHSLVDGNKRLGWLATAVFLELNGVTVTGITNDDVYDLVMGVAAGNREVQEIASRIRDLIDS